MSDSAPVAPLDPADMLGAVCGLPDQIDQARQRLAGFTLPESHKAVDSVVIAGMGGSAIGGDLACCLTADLLSVPVVVVRDYVPPAWLGPRSLFVASSFSGNTEETLAAFDEARAAGAKLVAVTSGGTLAQRAVDAEVPVVELPAGGQPRAALGASLAAILAILRAGHVVAADDLESRLAAATDAMRALVGEAELPAGGGGAPGALASGLVGRMPIVYAPAALAPVARRWKTQLNENAKTYAAWEAVPELDHNSVVGYRLPDGLPRLAHVVMLGWPGAQDRILRRMKATGALVRESGLGLSHITPPSGDRVVAALWLVQFGDLTSVYLAYRNRVDPTPVPPIDQLKSALAAGDAGA